MPENENKLRNVCVDCHTILYENPKNIVGLLPFYKDEVLLCQRAIEPRYSYWTLPAGFMELGETLEEGALREAKEEIGIDAKLKELFCIYQLPEIGQCYFVFLAELENKRFQLGCETLAAKWVKLDKIVYEEIAFTSIVFTLQKYQEWILQGKKQALPFNEVYKHN